MRSLNHVAARALPLRSDNVPHLLMGVQGYGSALVDGDKSPRLSATVDLAYQVIRIEHSTQMG